MNTEITDTVNKSRSWVCYDAECPLCFRGANRFRSLLERHGFALLPLQSAAVRETLRLPESELMAEMRVITPAGRVFGGADAFAYLSSVICKPLFWLTRIPGVMPLLRRAYRYVARNRGCAGNTCKTRRPFGERLKKYFSRFGARIFGFWRGFGEGAGLQNPVTEPKRSQNLKRPLPRKTFPNGYNIFENALARVGNPADWLPLLVLSITAAVFGRQLPPWLYMWVLALALFVGCKWLCFRQALAHGANATLGRKLGFLFGWIGMDAREFFKKPAPTEKPRAREFGFAALKILLGAILLWNITRRALPVNPLLAGWTGMIGLILFLHFGFFHLLSLVWRAAGVNAPPLMRAPLLARSLGEFWGKRWNTAFHYLVAKFLFGPTHRAFGVRTATMLVFLASGLVHDLVITVPARGGYGLPTLYFLLQGAGVLFEHTRLAHRLGINGGFRGWLFVFIITAGPAFWLFPPPFIHHVILPFLKCLGAI